MQKFIKTSSYHEFEGVLKGQENPLTKNLKRLNVGKIGNRSRYMHLGSYAEIEREGAREIRKTERYS